MITADQITFEASGRALVDQVSLTFDPGKLHLIIGVNGAGKSTFLKLLSRLLKPASGHVKYSGEDISQLTEHQLALRRALLSQSVEIGFSMRVSELVMMGRYPHFATHPGVQDRQVCEEVMRYFDALDLADREYATLSGGEKQRVHFARVLAQIWHPLPNGTRCLFLDEPLTFLDVRHQFEFMTKMQEFASQPDVIVVGVLHDLNLAARFAHRLILLHNGRVLEDGTPQQVLMSEHLKTAFGISPFLLTNPETGRTHLIVE